MEILCNPADNRPIGKFTLRDLLYHTKLESKTPQFLLLSQHSTGEIDVVISDTLEAELMVERMIVQIAAWCHYYWKETNPGADRFLGSIATQQANPTKNTMKKVQHFLDYASTHPDAILTYHASDMVLTGHSNASYLSKSKACSRAGGHFFMSIKTSKPPNNGAILTIAQIIKAVMSLAPEAEVGALYINCRDTIPASHTLEFMGHPQPLTPMQTNNTTALGVVNNNVIKKLKAMDIKYHWLCNRECQGQIDTTGPQAKRSTATT